MRGRTIAGLTSVLALTVFGVGSAAVGAGAGTRSGTEHFVSTSQSINSNTSVVQAFGPISGTGKDVQLNNNHDRFTFKNGSFIVTHHASSDLQSQDRKNCVFVQTEQGRYQIGQGTGAYKNVHGNGVYNFQVIGQGCDQNKPPAEGSIVIMAAGPITLG